MYAVRSRSGAPFRRGGIAFDGKAYRLLGESQMSPAIRNERSLEIVEVTCRDDPKLALHQVLEGDPGPDSLPAERDDVKASGTKSADSNAESK